MILIDLIQYFEEGPIIPLLLSIIALIAIIIQCFTKHLFLKKKLILIFILVFINAILLAFYSQLMETSFNIYLKYCFLALDIIGISILFTTIDYSMVNESFKDKLVDSLNQTKNYLVLDKKDRIKDISDTLLKTLNIEYKDAIGKNCFEVLDNACLIIGFNDNECRKKDILKYYDKYYTKVSPLDHKAIEIALQNRDGREFVLAFIETPIFRNDKYKGRILIGDTKDEEALTGIERQNDALEEELDVIRNRFITLLNKTNDGIFFNDLTNRSIWFNDVLVKKLFLTGNSLDSNEFYRNIHPDDIRLYEEKLSNISSEYSISYRYNVGGAYLYLKEEGNKIVSNSQTELCGIIKVLDDESFELSKTMLDIVSSEIEMKRRFNELIGSDKIFQVVYMRLDSIPEVNEAYGRTVGNNVINQYINYFKQSFVVDNLIFRVTGLEFVAFITSNNKMEALKNKFKDENKFLHPKLEFPGGRIETNVYMGITYSNDTPNRKELIKLAKEAMTISMSPKYSSNFAYYREIR